jgi:hypothetical protein
MESSSVNINADRREESKKIDVAQTRDALEHCEKEGHQEKDLPPPHGFSRRHFPSSETESKTPNTIGEGFKQREFQGQITVAQETKCENSSQSASSTKSGLVSPSSCSVSSQEHESKDTLKPTKTENVKSILSNDVSTNDGITSKMTSQTLTSQPFVVGKVDCPIRQAKPTIGEGPSKPPPSNVKPPPPKVGNRKRSNSLPLHVLSNSQVPGPQSVSSDAIMNASSSSKNKNLRRGKWTAEEEAYVARVIQDFNNGFLDAPAGTTLRSYLSDKLNCDPMRITKKFTGESCIGKRVFHPAVRCASNSSSIDKAQVCRDVVTNIRFVYLLSLSQCFILFMIKERTARTGIQMEKTSRYAEKRGREEDCCLYCSNASSPSCRCSKCSSSPRSYIGLDKVKRFCTTWESCSCISYRFLARSCQCHSIK